MVHNKSRPHVEAMAMGLPVIATNWSGPTAFLSDKWALPLRYDGLVELEDRTAPEKGEHARVRIRPIYLLRSSPLRFLDSNFREIPYGHENSTP